jgi:5-methylthioadenosine/S-adenosylhomocysteine deaminase
MLRDRGIAVAPAARSPIALLHDTGVLATRALLIHAVRADAADRDLVAAAGCAIAHCPASNAKLGHGIAPLGEWLAAGIPVGLGTDSVASNNRMDLLDEARAAVLMQRARLRRPDALSATAALELATTGGARALGLADRIGAIVPGMDADLAAFRLAGAHATPVHEPAAAAVFALSGSDAWFVAVRGVPLLRDGRLLRADAALPARVRDIAARLGDWARGQRAPGAAAVRE